MKQFLEKGDKIQVRQYDEKIASGIIQNVNCEVETVRVLLDYNATAATFGFDRIVYKQERNRSRISKSRIIPGTGMTIQQHAIMVASTASPEYWTKALIELGDVSRTVAGKILKEAKKYQGVQS